MRREYDIFEKFPDGPTLWKATVLGRYQATRTMQELAEHSPNEFTLVDVEAAAFLPVAVKSFHRQLAKATNG
jgi:hypothetical protein